MSKPYLETFFLESFICSCRREKCHVFPWQVSLLKSWHASYLLVWKTTNKSMLNSFNVHQVPICNLRISQVNMYISSRIFVSVFVNGPLLPLERSHKHKRLPISATGNCSNGPLGTCLRNLNTLLHQNLPVVPIDGWTRWQPIQKECLRIWSQKNLCVLRTPLVFITPRHHVWCNAVCW